MTTTTWLTELPYIKTDRAPQTLEYVVSPHEGAQARYESRVVAKPQVDLNAYTCRAVIDWLDVVVVLRSGTQFQHLQKPIEKMTGLVPFIKALDEGPGSVATTFRIRFQEARLTLVGKCLEEMRRTRGFAREPAVVGMEISVDFTPSVPSEVARHRMVGVLTHHLFPKTDIVVEPYDRPRFKWGRGKGKSRYLIGYRKRAAEDPSLLRWPEADEAAPVDATFYAGRQHGPAQWKVMDKILDRQNPATGARLELSESQKRARVEVTLNQDELRRIGIVDVQSLQRFKFTRLQRLYFQFMLPTFAIVSEQVPAEVVTALETFRARRFLDAGVAGLIMMDQVATSWRAVHRKLAVLSVQALGRKVLPPSRRGVGETKAFAAYEELNGRISSALAKLGAREVRRPGRGGKGMGEAEGKGARGR